jgi:catechol 2,3-dioxygenase
MTMNTITTPAAPAAVEFRIDPATLPGHVHLTVANLENELIFYQKVIGLKLHWHHDGAAGEPAGAGLGVGGADLVRLTEDKAARRYRGTTGIYHFAILLPDRRELARAIARLFALRWPNSPTDHVMTKTTYLDDPEGNNIELYTESPEDGVMGFANGEAFTRRADGSLSSGRDPVDLDELFSHLTPDDQLDQPMPPSTRIGHFHLYVANLPQAMDFYHGLLGFDDMGYSREFRMGMVSAGRYHHHIGLNTWMGEGAPPAPAGALGLRHIQFMLPSPAELERVLARLAQAGTPVEQTELGPLVRDPSQNAVILSVKTAS